MTESTYVKSASNRYAYLSHGSSWAMTKIENSIRKHERGAG